MAVPFLSNVKQLVTSQLLPKKHDTSVLGIDIGESAIKMVQLRNEHGVALLETYGEISLGPYGDSVVGQPVRLTPEMLAKALKELLQGAGATSLSAGVSVAYAASLVKLIEVPALDPKQLATVIPIEARKYIPAPIAEVQVDWFIVPETEQRLFESQGGGLEEVAHASLKKRMVLVAAMHNSMLQTHAQTMKLAGISPLFYEIEAFSVMRAAVDRSLTPVAIIDMGARTTKLYIIELGIILASHVVQKGSGDITKGIANTTHVSLQKAEVLKRQVGVGDTLQERLNEEGVSHVGRLAVEQVFSEMRRVLAGFQRKYNKAISKVVLTGGGASLGGIQEYAREQLEVEVEFAHPFSRTQAPAFLDATLRQSGVDFTVAVGLALRALQEAGSG